MRRKDKEITDIGKKINRFNKIIKHQTEMETVYSFTEDELKNVCVYKMVVKEFTGKES
jgi:hypothetical protein